MMENACNITSLKIQVVMILTESVTNVNDTVVFG